MDERHLAESSRYDHIDVVRSREHNHSEIGRSRFFAESGSKNYGDIKVFKKKDKKKTKPNPRRPFPTIVSPSLEVKTGKMYTEETIIPDSMVNSRKDSNYITIVGTPSFIENNTETRVRNHQNYDSDIKLSPYDLYVNRMKKLANDTHAGYRIDTQSQINSIF